MFNRASPAEVVEGPRTVPARDLTPAALRPAPQSGLYRTVWRWHFYAGLFTIPVIVLLCLSGITWLFRPQLDSVLYSHLTSVRQGTQVVSYDRQLAAVQRSYPESSIVSMDPPASGTSSTRFDIATKEGRNYSVFVDPYTGQVIGHRDNDRDPALIALKMHGSLMTESWLGDKKWGDGLIEIVASWAILLLATGVYLWWPRGRLRGSLRGVVVPRTRDVRRRTFWRDLHAVTGVLFSFVALFFLVTGMFWTGLFGTKYWDWGARLGSGYPPQVFQGVQSTRVEDLVKSGKPAWSVSRVPVPPSDPGDGKHHPSPNGNLQWDPRKGAPLDAVVARAQEAGFQPGFTITMPADEKGSYAIGNWPDVEGRPFQQASATQYAFVDQYTGELLGNYHHDGAGALAQASDLGIALHEGRQLGVVNQLLTLVAALAVLLSCATGVVMWLKRRPSGLGAPGRLQSRRAGLVVLGIAAALGLLFPLLGLSLLVVVVVEFAVLRRVPPVARFLGV